MVKTSNAGTWIVRVFFWNVGIALMIVIGVVQALGSILTAMSADILKSISILMILVTLLLLVFGLFSWTRALVVF